MNYLEKNLSYKDKKKNVGARVSEVVLSALNNAEDDSNDLGYTFSITRIIEKALQDTLDELVEKTGIDYLALEKFKFEMNERQAIRNINDKDSNWIDFDKKAHEIKLKALIDSSVDLNLLLKEEEGNVIAHWDKYVINRKDENVKTELENILEQNKNLEAQMSRMISREYFEGGGHDADMANNAGWGKIYSVSCIVGEESSESFLDEHNELIDAISKRSNQHNPKPLPKHLLDQYQNIIKKYSKYKNKKS
jgi:hypothetical protein